MVVVAVVVMMLFFAKDSLAKPASMTVVELHELQSFTQGIPLWY